MPNREDETWLNSKDNIRYCSKHQRYYDEKFGCQICFIERIEEDLKRKVSETPQLQICPECKQKSLFWNKDFGSFECLNLKCTEHIFTKDEINQRISDKIDKGQTCQTPTESKPLNTNQDKTNQKIEETPKIQEPDKPQVKQDTASQESSSLGRAWFNNEYFDPIDKKWKKPKDKKWKKPKRKHLPF